MEECRADGVAVLVKNSRVMVKEHTVVCPGRARSVNFCFCGINSNALNAYAPVEKQARWNLLHQLSPYMLRRAPFLFLGDFNRILETEGRRGTGRVSHLDKTSVPLWDMIGFFKLKDAFKSVHSALLGFTESSPGGSRASQIDFVCA